MRTKSITGGEGDRGGSEERDKMRRKYVGWANSEYGVEVEEKRI